MRHNLRKARKEKKLTQRELSAEIGISQQAFSLLERGRMDTSSDNWRRLAKALRASIESLSQTEPPIN